PSSFPHLSAISIDASCLDQRIELGKVSVMLRQGRKVTIPAHLTCLHYIKVRIRILGILLGTCDTQTSRSTITTNSVSLWTSPHSLLVASSRLSCTQIRQRRLKRRPKITSPS